MACNYQNTLGQHRNRKLLSDTIPFKINHLGMVEIELLWGSIPRGYLSGVTSDLSATVNQVTRTACCEGLEWLQHWLCKGSAVTITLRDSQRWTRKIVEVSFPESVTILCRYSWDLLGRSTVVWWMDYVWIYDMVNGCQWLSIVNSGQGLIFE